MAVAEVLDDNLAALPGSTSCAMRWRMRARRQPAGSRERICPALAATSASHTSCPRSRTPPIHVISSSDLSYMSDFGNRQPGDNALRMSGDAFKKPFLFPGIHMRALCLVVGNLLA
jgi:hypothetical protein